MPARNTDVHGSLLESQDQAHFVWVSSGGDGKMEEDMRAPDSEREIELPESGKKKKKMPLLQE